MIAKLAVWYLRKTKASVIINCDISDQTIGVDTDLILYDNTEYNATLNYKDGDIYQCHSKEATV